MLARDIVRITGQVNKMTEFIDQLTAVSMRITSISSLNELSNAMEEAGKAMTTVSSKLDTGKLAQMAKQMAKEDAKLDMKQDMLQDVLEGIGDGMDDPVEQEALYKEVLAQVGLQVDDLLPNSNAQEVNKPQKEIEKVKVAVEEEDSLDAMLKSLQK